MKKKSILWKKFEQLTKQIEQTLNSQKKCVVKHNIMLKNEAGYERQFDVVVFSEDKVIAIECKYYNSKISVEKIEAFHSKCIRVSTISDKIIVCKKGFQKRDTIAAAKFFNIKLISLQELKESSIFSWIIPNSFSLLELKMKIDYASTKIGLASNFEDNIQITSNSIISNGSNIELKYFDFLSYMYTTHEDEIKRKIVEELFDKTKNIRTSKHWAYTFDISDFYIYNNKKNYLTRLFLVLKIDFNSTLNKSSKTFEYKNELTPDTVMAEVAEFGFGTKKPNVRIIKDVESDELSYFENDKKMAIKKV